MNDIIDHYGMEFLIKTGITNAVKGLVSILIIIGGCYASAYLIEHYGLWVYLVNLIIFIVIFTVTYVWRFNRSESIKMTPKRFFFARDVVDQTLFLGFAEIISSTIQLSAITFIIKFPEIIKFILQVIDVIHWVNMFVSQLIGIGAILYIFKKRLVNKIQIIKYIISGIIFGAGMYALGDAIMLTAITMGIPFTVSLVAGECFFTVVYTYMDLVSWDYQKQEELRRKELNTPSFVLPDDFIKGTGDERT